MNNVSCKKRYMFFVILIILFSSTIFSRPRNDTPLSEIEIHEILNNKNYDYINLDKAASKIYKVITRLIEWDVSENSLLHDLKRHIENGFSIGEYDAVTQTIEYAQSLLESNYQHMNNKDAISIARDLRQIVDQIKDKRLIINAQKFSLPQKENVDLDVTRDKDKHSHAKIIIFKEDVECQKELAVDEDTRLYSTLKVYGKSYFKKHVTFNDKVTFKEDVKFKDDVKFEDDVKIKGNLKVKGTTSLADTVIENLTVLSCVDQLCVNNLTVTETTIGTLSVTDLVVDNLSAMDAFIENASIDILSANDAVIQNLTVVNCMDNLCVTNLTVTNETVTTLSATDIVISDLSVGCDLTVGCNISMVDSSDAEHGNIIKDGSRWIHNYPGLGTGNVYMGLDAGNFTGQGTQNVGIGFHAMISNGIGSQNVAIGGFALDANTVGNNNSVLGYQGLGNNVSGNDNTAVGAFALSNSTVSLGNTGVGRDAGLSLTLGDNNTLLGNRAGINLTTGNTNIMVGFNAGLNLTTGDNNIYIGNPGNAVESGVIRIGTPAVQTQTFIQGIFGSIVGGTGVPVDVDAAGQLGTVVSSKKFKTRVNRIDSVESEKIYDLIPVTFIYKEDSSGAKQYGLIAEDVALVLPELVVNDAEGKPFTVRYQLLPILLLNEIKRLNGTVQNQAAIIDELKNDNKQLTEMVQNILKRLTMN